MTMTPDTSNHVTRRITYRIPIIGRIAREIVEGDDTNALYGVAMLVSMWLCSILLFGYAGLIVPALMLVAAMFIVIIRISMG